MKNINIKAVVKRRNFFGYLAAFGSMLGGIVPELRAQSVVNSNMQDGRDSLPPPPPLSPSMLAMMYSKARADSNVRKLVNDAGPNLFIGKPTHSYDLGEMRYIALPLRNTFSGLLTAYLYYSSFDVIDKAGKSGTLSVAMSIRSDRVIRLADFHGNVVSAPAELQSQAELFYTALSTPHNLASARSSEPPKSRDPLRQAYCEEVKEMCMATAWSAFLQGMGWGGACLLISAGTFLLTVGPGWVIALVIVRGATFACAGGNFAKIRTYWRTKKECEKEFEICLGEREPPPVPYVSTPPSVPQGMPMPSMTSPPPVPEGMPTPPFMPHSPAGKV
jgi:hypothetical protein